MIFLCYITNILSAANSSESDLLIDKNTGDKKDGTNTTTQGMISGDAYNASDLTVNIDMLSDNTKIDSKAVPADLTQNGGNKLQDGDMNSEDGLDGAKHNLQQKDEPKNQDKVFVIDANGNVRDTRYNHILVDANNTGSDARLANSSNERKDGNNARKTAADDSKASKNDAEEAKTQQAYEDHIKVNQSKYRGWLKERYDKYLSMGGMQNITIEDALTKQITWKEYQNLRRFLELEIERLNGAPRNGLNNTSKHIAINVNGKPSVNGHLQVRGNFATAEKVGNKATPTTDEKNDKSQTQLNTKVTQNQEIEKQENTTNTQEKGIPDEEKKQKNLSANLQNDAKNVMQERASHEPKNQTATGENKTGNIWNHEPIKHYSATKNRRPATMNTNLKKNDKNKNIAKSKAANKKSDTKEKSEKSFYQRNRMLIIILSLVGVCALTLAGLWFYLSQKVKQ